MVRLQARSPPVSLENVMFVIAVIVGSTREGRFSEKPRIGSWNS